MAFRGARPQRPAAPSLPFATGGDRPERSAAPPSHVSYQSTDTLTSKEPLSPSGSPSPFLPGDRFDYAPVLPVSSSANGPQVQFQDGARPTHFSDTPQQQRGAFGRKKSLVRHDRQRLDPSHPLFNYANHAAAMQADGAGRVYASTTGNTPFDSAMATGASAAYGYAPGQRPDLRRGKSIFAREEGDGAVESGLSILKRGATLRMKSGKSGRTEEEKERVMRGEEKPLSPWMTYCRVLTCCCTTPVLRCFGMRTKERQSAFREKMGLLSLIMLLMMAVGFLTFGFTQAVCGKPPLLFHSGTVQGGSMIFHGYDYSMDKFTHPGFPGIENGSNPLYSSFASGGMDGSFLFQNVNQNCLGIINPAPKTGIPSTGGSMGWYFPCNLYNQFGTSAINKTGYTIGQLCHTQSDARDLFARSSHENVLGMQRQGQVSYSWHQVTNSSRNLGVYENSVLDFSLLAWLDSSQVTYPALFDSLAKGNASFQGQDITMQMVRLGEKAMAQCLVDVIRVGFIDTATVGCFAADVVLYVSLVFIIGVVLIRFTMAVIFGWFLSWKLGAFKNETLEQRRARAAEIEMWTDDIYRPAPARYRPNVKKSVLPTKSRFTANISHKPALSLGGGTASGGNNPYIRGPNLSGDFRRAQTGSIYGAPSSIYGAGSSAPSVTGVGKILGAGMKNSPPNSPTRNSSSSIIKDFGQGGQSRRSSVSLDSTTGQSLCPFPLQNVVPQPPKDFEPFNFPLAHSICLVTAYSESPEGLRTTLDSLATTDYPNSHKLLMVIADGMVKGSGNSMATPEIILSMMKDLVILRNEVEPHSYVAIADGHKRHNMAKIYAGYYDYDDSTVEPAKQQRVPMILVAKVGNPAEAHEAKPGNRGKRDSQIILMSFLQKVMFDERMTQFEYEFFNSIWRCTGISPDNYELILMVDADTKVFPDSLTRMAACMVNDPEIMGLCGETKIANKSETWVTMIQVFEYYISHHSTKAFESMFGGVTCLPGCFSMYRIKAPKGNDGYWVPILANPDIVEHYSENVVDTLHKKNLLLLGEDRYLTTLMLKTFPKRKMMFCPQAVCKTIVPDTFSVLLSQRRRWINSTIHNLSELILVRDLCGTFCFSMQFVVGMELAGTLVLPAAIAFTIYLLVLTAIPGTVKPVIPLILLAIILGLPGLLIVVTSRRMAYVGWMVIYIFSLPVWNFILPAYAYLHMDDFSWGQTRKVFGETEENHGDKDGEFDSSNIVMKRWAEFERDRRRKATGTHSRDSTYDVIQRSTSPAPGGSPHRSESPRRENSRRQSIGSSSETFQTQHTGPSENLIYRNANASTVPIITHAGAASAESESVSPTYARTGVPTQLELPAPLATASSVEGSVHDAASFPDRRSTPSGGPPGLMAHYAGSHVSSVPSYSKYDRLDDDRSEVQAMLASVSPPLAQGSLAVLPTGHTSDVSVRPYGDDDDDFFTASPQPTFQSTAPSYPPAPPVRPTSPDAEVRSTSKPSRYSGVSLVDHGPVAANGQMKTVQRTRRDSSTGTSAVRTGAQRQSIDVPEPTSPPRLTASPQRSLPPGARPS